MPSNLLQINPVALQQLQQPLNDAPVLQNANTLALQSPTTGSIFDPVNKAILGYQQAQAQKEQTTRQNSLADRRLAQQDKLFQQQQAEYKQTLSDRKSRKLSVDTTLNRLYKNNPSSFAKNYPSLIVDGKLSLNGLSAEHKKGIVSSFTSEASQKRQLNMKLSYQNKANQMSLNKDISKSNAFLKKHKETFARMEEAYPGKLELAQSMADAGNYSALQSMLASGIQADYETVRGNLDKGVDKVSRKVLSTNSGWDKIYNKTFLKMANTATKTKGIQPTPDQWTQFESSLKENLLSPENSSKSNSEVLRETMNGILYQTTSTPSITGQSIQTKEIVDPIVMMQSQDGQQQILDYATRFGIDPAQLSDENVRLDIAKAIIADKADEKSRVNPNGVLGTFSSGVDKASELGNRLSNSIADFFN